MRESRQEFGEHPDVSVIIINWNTRDYLARCLDSLAQGGLEGVSAEVWVVDNASSDGSAELVGARYPWARLVANERNLGFAAANNAVMRQAAGRLFLLLNADMVVPAGVIRELASRMAVRPEVGIAACRQVDGGGAELESYMFEYMGGRVPGAVPVPARPAGEAREVEVAWVWGSGMMVRREMFEQTGGFDESFFLYYEDLDWCWRVRRAGWKVLCYPDLQVTHFVRRSTSRVSPRVTAGRLVAGELALMERHLPRRRLRRFLLGRFLYSLRGVAFYRVMLALAPCERYQAKYHRYLANVVYIGSRHRLVRELARRWALVVRRSSAAG
jgi:GT2 family glycosyltransferase